MFPLLFVALFAWVAPTASAQAITIAVGEVSGSVGETVLVPVTLSGVESTSGFNSVQFKVKTSNANLTYLPGENEREGTLMAVSSIIGWLYGSFPNGIVAGSGGSLSPITSSGTLIKLAFRIESDSDLGYSLADIEIANTGGGFHPLSFEPAIPSFGPPPAGSPEPVNDSYTVDEGGTLTVSTAQGVLANDIDPDGDPMTVSLFSDVSHGNLSLQANGSFIYVHDGTENLTDSFMYSATDGTGTANATVTITMNQVNETPGFGAGLQDTEAFIGQNLSISFAANDPESDPLTFELLQGPAGSAVNPSTGVFSWTVDAPGDHVVQVSVTDGEFSVNSPEITVSVNAASAYLAQLKGYHRTQPVTTSGSGNVDVFFSSGDNILTVTGSFSGATSPAHTGSYLYMGAWGSDGTKVLDLNVTAVSNSGTGEYSGSFAQAVNTFDLDDVTLPTGITVQDVSDALDAGEAYILVTTVGNLGGELRAQIRPQGNTAPDVPNAGGPATALAEGDPSTSLFSITWTESTIDPNGDMAKLFFVVSNEDGNVFRVEDVTSANSVDFTVREAADLYDDMTTGTSGSVAVGGSVTATMSLVATDGSAIAQSNHDILITRGLITATKPEPEVPDAFVLRGNYPNPFNPTTTIHFDLPETADVSVTVLDMLGRTMISVPDQTMNAGTNQSIRVEAGELASGIYVYRVVARGAGKTHVATGTMTLIK